MYIEKFYSIPNRYFFLTDRVPTQIPFIYSGPPHEEFKYKPEIGINAFTEFHLSKVNTLANTPMKG